MQANHTRAVQPQQTQQQAVLAMDYPESTPEAQMRALFEARWVRWHHCKSYEAAVADPVTRRLLSLAVQHGAAHALGPGQRR